MGTNYPAEDTAAEDMAEATDRDIVEGVVVGQARRGDYLARIVLVLLVVVAAARWARQARRMAPRPASPTALPHRLRHLVRHMDNLSQARPRP